MRKISVKPILILLIIVFNSRLLAQLPETRLTEASIDSISWQQYLTGDWDGLISTGKLAAENGINFKWLQQRLGYAHFVKGHYYKSTFHYQKALKMDSSDEVNHLYLYYNALNTGHLLSSRYHAGKLSSETIKELHIRSFQPIYSIDAEYSYKRPERFYIENEYRMDAQYRRIGLHSLLGYQLSLYQTVSGFTQDFDIVNSTNQLEYLVLASIQLSSNSTLQAGYRYVGTRSVLEPDTFYTPGHSLNGSFIQTTGRFDLTASVNWLKNDYVTVDQIGLQLGTGFAGAIPVYLTTSIYRLNESGINLTTLEEYTYPHYVFNQTAGFMPFKKTWIEASVTLGDQNYFVGNNAMYLFNAQDPVQLKTGFSITQYFTHKLALSVHYGLEQKYIASFDETYYQQGLTAGITWKL